ncbi:MAG TPA: hypothetical protein VHL80_13385 [Polyangia bacterium]|nr:hypothetical protein [Polyangia bacterium]
MAKSAPAAKVPARRPRLRVLRRALVGLAALAAGYLALVIHPQPLFAYTLQRGNIVLHARAPLPPEAAPMLDDALARVSRSPLYDAARTHDVFLCDTPRLYGFFAMGRRSGGITQTWAAGNVFIRPANVRRGRVLDSAGREKGGERTLAYFVAHEVTHAMAGDRFGRFSAWRLAPFQNEGYADYVAYARPVDLARGRADLQAGTIEMDPARSGLYDRYRLLVGYLLQRRGLSVDDLFARKLDRAEIERELAADDGI